MFKFKKYGDFARIGEISINGKKLETPYLFPVIGFFCGGLEKSSFGGGIYRNIKEEFISSKGYSNIFQGVLTSISHLADFHVTKNKLENLYLAKTIHEWFNFNGVLFVDSGGFKVFTNGSIKCTDFEIKPEPKEILRLQNKFGGDIIATLDYPIHPNLSPRERKKRIRRSIENAVYALNNKPKKTAVYLAVHGHSHKELEEYFSNVAKEMDGKGVSKYFDGIAIGSLVPIRNDYGAIIDIVKSCKEILDDNGYKKLPVHVFGISSSLMPILVYLGVDTFDSASYLYSALNGRYFLNDFKRSHINNVDFKKCDCGVCRDKAFVRRMKGKRVKYVKDQVAPIAIHNLIKHYEELNKIKKVIIKHRDEAQNHLLDRSKKNKRLNKAITLIF